MTVMIGSEVRRLREALGLTQAELAEELGVHPITISRWERDKARVPSAAARLLTILVKAKSSKRRS